MLSNIDLTAAKNFYYNAGYNFKLSDRLNEAMLYLRVINQAKALRLDRAYPETRQLLQNVIQKYERPVNS